MVGRGCVCAVYGCNNYRMQSDRKSFYRFPRNKEICEQWVIRCNRADLDDVFKTRGSEFLNRNYVVCSDHFAEKDFRNKNTLKQGVWPGALPSLLLCTTKELIYGSTTRKKKREDSVEEESVDIGSDIAQQNMGVKAEPQFEDETSKKSLLNNVPKHILGTVKMESDYGDENKCGTAVYEDRTNPLSSSDHYEVKPEPTMLKVELDSDNEIKDKRASEEGNEVLMPFKFVPVGVKEECCDADNKDDVTLEKTDELTACVDRLDSLPVQVLCNMKAISSDNSSHEKGKKERDFSFVNKCEICNKIFSEKGVLKRHYRVHTGEKPFKCKYCLKTFSQSGSLHVHLRIHTGERPFRCDICERDFVTKQTLKDHCLQHLTERQHKCDICDKVFSMSINLKTHYLTHTGGKTYKCRICQKDLAHQKGMARHLLTHTGEKPYKCNICGKKFNVRNNLKRHIRTTHAGKRLYVCEICNKKFSANWHLQRHVRRHKCRLPLEIFGFIDPDLKVLQH